MRKLLFLSIAVMVMSCQQSTQQAPKTGDAIKDSKAYVEYVEAYNDYQSCKHERPALTQAYMNKEIGADDFQTRLEKNTKVCQLKKQVFNTRWKILEAQFDKNKLSQDYRLEE